jgi:hypothetical protein
LQIFQFRGAMDETVHDAHPHAYPRRRVAIPPEHGVIPMSNVGFNGAAPLGCGMSGMQGAAGYPTPAPYYNPDGSIDTFAIPVGAQAFGAGAAIAMPAERFISTLTGGVIVGKDGEPAGRVPEGSFVDTKSGKLYGPDSKPITLPEGATVDFFDLPDLDQLVADAKAATGGGSTESDPPETAPGKHTTGVMGQWGPGGFTPFEPGTSTVAGMGEDCGMDHGAPGKVAGASGGGAVDPARVAIMRDQIAHATAMGASPATIAQMRHQLQDIINGVPGETVGPLGGGASNVASLQDQLRAAMAGAQGVNAGGMAMPGMLAAGHSMHPPAFPGSYGDIFGGGLATAVGGANGLGTIPGLQSSLLELVATLRELTAALQETTRGGGPGGKAEPPAPGKESGTTTTPPVEPPSTDSDADKPSIESASSSSDGSSSSSASS